MDNNLWNSAGYVILYIVLFYLLWSGMVSGTIGRFNLALMLLVPVLGIFRVRKSQYRIAKTVLITLHIIAICTIGFLLLLGLGMGEK